MRGRILLAVLVLVAVSPSAGQSGSRGDSADLPDDNLVAVEATVRVSGSGTGYAAITGEYEPSWLLVQLDRSIGEVALDGTLPLETGLDGVDRLIREMGIHRIEMALPVSSRAPADPEAFRRYGFDRTYRFHVPVGTNIQALVERFGVLIEVNYAEPDYLGKMSLVPNDPRYALGDQWNLETIDAPGGWDITTGDAVTIAINDSGADVSHSDLTNKLDPGWNFGCDCDDVQDQHGHGTSVSSVAAAETNNSTHMAGVCWGCRIMPVARASDSHSSYTDALVWAVDHGARIINGSYGTDNTSWTLLNGVGYTMDAGVIHVVSCGNDYTGEPRYPSYYVETISVGATTADEDRAGFSNWGPWIDVVAPGEDVVVAELGGGTRLGSGTSYAAPHVAGLAGLVLSLNPSAGQEEVRHLIRSGAEDEVGDPLEDTHGFDEYHGWGRINVRRTLEAAEASSTLRVDGKSATRLYFETANPLADSYDFARGNLAMLAENHLGIDVGSLTCLENDSADADTAGNEDTGTPAPGEAFFYLGRFNAAPGTGSYGGSSRNRDRRVFRAVAEADWFVDGGQEGAAQGQPATAGDVNGDGYDDVIVGAYLYDANNYNDGAAFLYLGSAEGLVAEHSWMAAGDTWYAQFGYSTGPAGDVNGDGYDDVIIGARRFSNGENMEGGAFVYFGEPAGLADTPGWTGEGDQDSAHYGEWAATAGDVNHDGFDDVLVAAPSYDNGETDEGKVFLYNGSPSGPSTTPDWTFESNQADAYLGTGFARAGDLNGDGFDDIAIGAPGYDAGETDEGRVYVFYGSLSGPGSTPDLELEVDVAGAWFGTVAAGAGDVDADGFDDLVVSAVYYTNGEQNEGAVFLYRGGPSGLSTSYTWSFESDTPDAEMGWIAWTAGDVDNDGYDDIMVCDYGFELRSWEGKARVFSGSASGPSQQPVWSMSGDQTAANFAVWGFRAGDVNGDGFDDIILGAPGHDNEFWDEGRAYVFHGPLTETPTADCPK